MDPWVITPQERVRHQEQFNATNPENGFITGAQAKGFFMQSGLPPMMLAQIWGLADMNGDGKMDIGEFSVACKLINLRLKGVELPKTLPQQIFGRPNQLPMQGMPQHGMQGMMPQQQMGMPGMGMPGAMGMHGAMGGGMPGGMGMPGAMGMGGMMGGGMHGMPGGMPGMMPNASMAGMMPNTSMMGMMPGQMGMARPPVPSMPGMMGMGQPQHNPAIIPGVQPSVVSVPKAAPAPAVVEWAIPQQKRVAFSAQFQMNDKAKTGYLAAVQARNLLLQTGLAQQTLATVWNLADVDKDGKLSCEEFILAMHLCDLGMKGEPLPQTIPFNLIPPSLRKNMTPVPGTPGSVKSGTEEVMSPASFEDKRRENWDAGQAELQKRRASLLDQQKRDEEGRKKKEKEEAEQREIQKQEIERRRLAELERQQLQRQLAEEQRQAAEQQREMARKEMEKQRLDEWEKQRRSELEQHRQRETEKVLMLRAQKETLNAELGNMKTTMTDLTNTITETRTGVTEVKAFIDGMRTSRDTKMADLNALKNQLKEQNQRLMQVTQEKSKLESKNLVNQKKVQEGRVVEITDFDLKKEEKENSVADLRKNLDQLKGTEKEKKEAVDTNKQMLMEHRDKLKQMIEACKALHENFDEKRRDVRAEKQKKIRELTDPNHAWGAGFDGPAVAGVAEPEPVPAAAEVIVPAAAAVTAAAITELAAPGYLQYQALYDYEARNEDELSFSVNDIIMVHPEQEHEPGWLGGELKGKIGWFPEAYAQRMGEGGSLQPIQEVSETGSDNGSLQDPGSVVVQDTAVVVEPVVGAGVEDVAPALEGSAPVAEPQASEQNGVVEAALYVSVYPYTSEEPDDLTFDLGETINVTGKNGDWWTGSIGDRTGVFPYNYVEPAPSGGTSVPSATAADPGVTFDQQPEDKAGKMEIAKVIAPYTATSKEQLTLAQGQMVLIRKKTETGWWQGELQAGGKGKKRAVGWFPASYVQLMAAAEKKASVSSTAPTQQGEKYVALFDYNGQYEDELSFKEGDVLNVTNKEEADWWRGALNDKEGVFPANYVEPAK